jgi:hypothetical protein
MCAFQNSWQCGRLEHSPSSCPFHVPIVRSFFNLPCCHEFKIPAVSSLDFLTTGFLWGGALYPMLNPQPGGPDLHICNPPETGWHSYKPRHWVPILIAFYDLHRLWWDYSYPPVTTWTAFITLSAVLSSAFCMHNGLIFLTVFSVSFSLNVTKHGADIFTLTF